MPVVKPYTGQVNLNPLPGVRLTAPSATEASLGVPISNAVQKVAGQIYTDELLKQDEVAGLEAENKLASWQNTRLYNPQGGALTARGKDAFGLPDEIDKEYGDVSSAIRESLSNERQRSSFDRVSASRRASLNHTLSNHAYVEMRKFDDAETDNGLLNSRQTAISDFTKAPEEIERQRKLIYQYARRNGLGSEYVAQKSAQAESDTHVGIIDRFLAQGADQVAKQYFDKNKGSIAGDDIAKVEQKLNVATVDGAGQRNAVAIWNDMGPKNDLAPVNQDAMVAEARKKYGDEPKVLKATMDALKEQTSIFNASQRERMEGNSSAVWTEIQKGATYNSIRGMPEFLALPGKERENIKVHMTERADKPKQRSDLDVYYSLVNQSTLQREEFAKVNLLEYRTKLSEVDFKRLADVQAAIRKGDQKEQDKLQSSDRVQKGIVDRALLDMKLDPTPNEKTSKAKIDKINLFRRSVEEQTRMLEGVQQKNATDEQVQKIVDRLVERVTLPGSGWLFDDTVPAFQIKIDDVPKNDRTRAADALRRGGKPVTNEAIVELYRAKLLKQKAANRPASSETSAP